MAGVGLIYAFEPAIAEELARGRLRVVLERYAPAVPGLFLCFPSRAQVSPALRAFVSAAREMAEKSNHRELIATRRDSSLKGARVGTRAPIVKIS